MVLIYFGSLGKDQGVGTYSGVGDKKSATHRVGR